ncbi:MAG: sugar transferase [Planctomycetes bacterium]|nr:sugar transferase [Planctomycetota bacterium]
MNILSFKVQRWFKNLKVGVENIGIMGYSNQSIDLVKKIMNIPRMPYHFCGYILSRGPEICARELVRQDSNIIGYTDEIPAIINKYSLDRIIICSASVKNEETLLLARTCEKMGVHLNIVPDIINFISNRITLTDIDNIPLIEIKRPGFTRWDFGVKRVFDLSAILVLGAVLFPLLCLIVVLTKLDSRGPIFYAQKRIGKGSKYFSLYKFRSMSANADRTREGLEGLNEADGYLFKIKNDPRITRIGRFLRRYSLDELPQIFNVLKGEMSIVGPRPLPTADLEKMSRESEYNYWLEERCKVLPGITGLWQINGRSNAKFDELVSYDMYYLENWSLWLDFQILLKTIPVVLSSRGAY